MPSILSHVTNIKSINPEINLVVLFWKDILMKLNVKISELSYINFHEIKWNNLQEISKFLMDLRKFLFGYFENPVFLWNFKNKWIKKNSNIWHEN